MEYLIYVWTAIVVITLVVEFLTMDLVSIWFSAGSLGALVTSAITDVLWIQILVFVVISGLLLAFVRKLTLKYLDKGTKKLNADSLVGKKFKLLTQITEDTVGTVKVNGITWNCVAADKAEIAEKTEVEILEIKGNKLIVKEIK